MIGFATEKIIEMFIPGLGEAAIAKNAAIGAKGVSQAAKIEQIAVKTIDNVADGASNPATVKYYRVQGGGSGSKTSQHRINVNDDGTISIPNKKSDLNISAYDSEHAKYFRDTNRPGGDIIEFEVPTWFDVFVKETIVPQDGYKKNPKNQGGSAPKLVDPTTPGTSYEFPKPWIEWIEEYASNAKKLE
ncbi:hypothetical protein PCURB6_12180 [Paenibacillus curdlanolyticus]|nr:hypothetical protein PCURB6_12180 [Paenibacillus curdlanolyticus]